MGKNDSLLLSSFILNFTFTPVFIIFDILYFLFIFLNKRGQLLVYISISPTFISSYFDILSLKHIKGREPPIYIFISEFKKSHKLFFF